MTIRKDCGSLSWIEIKTLHRLITSPGPLKCNGSYWTHASDPKFAVALETITSLCELGWIKSYGRAEGGDANDWMITPEGKAAWEDRVQREFGCRVERQIDEEIAQKTREEAARRKLSDENFANSCVYLGNRTGVWIPRR